ncbi:cell wall-binding repeat-containing protein [Clostridium sp. CF012]|uniref:cell wall-binding repeat-containing protein n=1 Tax=Clostridium sp. CF012 TaxID=2843319 RepID=UPI001C0B298A|nr:cell wall-binding repeat-containing protein [Clostridium sp. CF012]MBU3146874.1 cell wall-binding repeat-containing protein [Clostridium sp. CF012]
MYKKHMKLLILITFMLTMITSTSVLASSNHTRLSGIDRYETSSKIALNGWTQSDYAVLALGEDYPDALCAAPLAGKYKAPILLTKTNSIPTSTLATIKQLQVKNIFIVGGTGVISKAVQERLTELGVITTRLAGKTRYDTAIAVAKQLGNVSQIAIVTGEDYADALSIAPIAASLNMPIIIVEHNSIPQSVTDYVASQRIDKTYVVGKGTSINNVAGLPNVIEINGTDKYARNISIINAFKSSSDFSTIYLATGENFADALSGSALAGNNSNVLLLVENDITKGKNLLQLDYPNANIKILGGVGAIADSTVISIDNTTTSSAITIPTTVDDSAVTKGTKVSKITITSTRLGIASNGHGYATYSIYDENGKDITNSSLSDTVTFKSQVGTIVVKRGLLTLTPNADISFSTLSSVVITGRDSITGVSMSATLIVPAVL